MHLFLTISVAIGCGKTSSENCTYFESTGSEGAGNLSNDEVCIISMKNKVLLQPPIFGISGACTIKICPCSSGICQVTNFQQSYVVARFLLIISLTR